MLLYSSHLPLGVPNGLVIYHASTAASGRAATGRATIDAPVYMAVREAVGRAAVYAPSEGIENGLSR
jgi:hypothetical protein